MINLNKWAREITLKEGKKISVSIAQVKEIMGIFLRDLKKMTIGEITGLLKKIK
jgi:predicted DNA-binding antitoxin AbrB/MazE fold protein